ncbi:MULTISPECIES: biliverdin-producing heme oxygenase [Thalassospira]|uniref:Biliverdin-producing heme oxygenase n=1 Tax=Thalassospira aquimaris TaxID=3037796 RepID=A0ABT6G9N4_9PROT|nr:MULTISPECIES: biliverdin-producing heme oxygenase [Thalassospira]MDG4718710.1 biliverdin-producing heme oxygenase [Thalassospira sp. FZY0004]
MNAIVGQPVGDIPRLEEIRQSTRSAHQSVDNMVMAMAPFDNRANYARFLGLQYIFHARMKPLYDAKDLNATIPGLAKRSRFDAVCRDMDDLETEHPKDRSRLAVPQVGAERIGWLYVCEGSSLGAAFLLKAAANIGLNDGFGARHLAGHADGRGKHWREFVEQLNGLTLDDDEEAAVRKGAVDGFAFFRNLVSSSQPA